MTVRAVDQYWNLADTTNVGTLRLVASDNSFADPGNPQENYVPFVNGRRTFNGFLTDEGTVSVTVYDEDDLAKPSQSSHIPVDPPYEYEITVPATASTGPVPGFQVTVKLIDPVTGNVVPTAMNRFYLTPLLPNQGAANGTLGIDEAQLVGGVCGDQRPELQHGRGHHHPGDRRLRPRGLQRRHRHGQRRPLLRGDHPRHGRGGPADDLPADGRAARQQHRRAGHDPGPPVRHHGHERPDRPGRHRRASR